MFNKKEALHQYWFARMMWYNAVVLKLEQTTIDARFRNTLKWRNAWQGK